MLGTDPEFPIRSRSGRFVPAHRVLGDAAHKHPVAPGVVAFRDGFVVELNVTPAKTPLELVQRVQMGIRGVTRLLPRVWELTTNAAFKIDLADMRKAPEDVRHFGCTPSYCAYTGNRKIPDADPMTTDMRCAGAHMHFSANPEEIARDHQWLMDREAHMLFIRMLDFAVGLPLATIFHSRAQYERRSLYGQAGEYRPQEYPDGSLGLEYRTPPPQLWNHAEIAMRSFAVGEEIFRNFNKLRRIWDPSLEPLVREAINTGEGREDVPELKAFMGFDADLIEKYSNGPIYRMFQLPYQQLS